MYGGDLAGVLRRRSRTRSQGKIGMELRLVELYCRGWNMILTGNIGSFHVRYQRVRHR